MVRRYHMRLDLKSNLTISHLTGGSEMLINGHRFDTVAIANGQVNSGIPCESSSTMWTST